MSPAQNGGGETILELRDLKTHFHTPDGVVKAVDGVSYSLKAGETLGVVGESGCGKSVTALSILRLIPTPPGRISGGGIHFKGQDLTKMKTNDLRKIRGNEISMIFQEPMTSLNPVFTIGFQIAEAVMLHQGLSKKDALNKSAEMLDLVGIPLPFQRIKEYPHQLSGGMRQRAMIAMALSCNPSILLADEPTTALDVTIQAQILDLLYKLKDELGTAIIMITHDLGLIAETCQRVVVMYAGKIVEEAPIDEIFANPLHPYTIGLLNSVPKLRTSTTDTEKVRLQEIPGIVPSLHRLPTGCYFNPRCNEVVDNCRQAEPELKEVSPGHFVRCLLRD
ncbi:MAG: ABC transporter ATP-binding protein [Nitrospinaceae bacterium]|jgi:oligopeptide/dipeptide ABC transporter ATP-binding protein|nr:ABC transporter ATP-binding protein [Nitrospinaceae bacterium]MBT3435761.1 ABC transporter ATP-binding protein [Nitrospinaceae bacterium]MBT3819792.1 ABC transporter ATP-binding protein [Nitrospinaceae bacterium]MBT4093204.1 ABC transporter ATP-binding protein [Nitrospinaceae bacterium]MBT4430675.1 ABC transporter ATP-binding protein [Nitrospinaceae bacterium]